ncbi:FecR family protein [Steroidobacter sp.]|uniref:FecR family protein n=1 Tax=Steroidobacter sp. TaxID=1978227 RepID=UPI001A524AB9|nr:FecR domain-containing protein [Steroidobacter sp.]MBL8271935.1 FecR domain-containing protein [Steroidobacter sp.]
MDSREHIEQQAAEWLAKRDSGQWSAEDQAALSAWLAASTAHMVEFLRLEAAWDGANRLQALGAQLEPVARPLQQAWHSAPSFRGALRTAAWAAGLLVCVALASSWYWNRNTYSTQIGATLAVPLPEGSTVTLNTASHVRVDLRDTQRTIELERGEAYFEVAHDEHRPFVVIAGKSRITALGTAFSVRRNTPDDVRVTVAKGRVSVVVDSAVARAESDARIGAPVELDAGSVAEADREEVSVLKRPLSEIEEALSWRSGFLVFHDTPLIEAVAEFNRYHTRQVIIQDASLATIPVSGNFRAGNFDAFSRLLDVGFQIRIEEQQDGRLLLQSK